VYNCFVAETCEKKVEKVKTDAQEACNRQSQTALDQLKHEQVLDKRKAIEEALLMAQKQWQQQLEQVESERQKSEKQFKQQHPAVRQKLQRSFQQSQKTEQEGEKQQADQQQQPQREAVNQQPKQSPQKHLSENESHQYPRYKQAQDQQEDAVPHQPAEPVLRLPEQSLQQQQQNLKQMQHDRQQRQIGILQQVPVRRQRSALHGAAQHLNDNQLPEAPLHAHTMQSNKPEQRHPQHVPQDVVDGKQKTADEQVAVVNLQQEHQSANQELQQSGPTAPQLKPEQQKPRQPSVFQVPRPVRASDYKQAVDEQVPKRDIKAPAPPPGWKLQQIDVNRQQQFEQLQQDKLREQLPNQKGFSLCCKSLISVLN